MPRIKKSAMVQEPFPGLRLPMAKRTCTWRCAVVKEGGCCQRRRLLSKKETSLWKIIFASGWGQVYQQAACDPDVNYIRIGKTTTNNCVEAGLSIHRPTNQSSNHADLLSREYLQFPILFETFQGICGGCWVRESRQHTLRPSGPRRRPPR